MDVFYFALILSFCAGIALILYAMYNFHGNDEAAVSDPDYLLQSIENKLNDMKLPETEEVLDEFSNLSDTVFKELDEKREELLFLYSLIDEKKNELSNAKQGSKEPDKAHRNVDVMVKDNIPYKYKNNKLDDILRLKKEGLSVSEISKKLGMGQGEVSLIMELSKGR